MTPGAIVLMHTGPHASGTPTALPGLIRALKTKGYTFMTVGNMLNVSKQPVKGPTSTVQPTKGASGSMPATSPSASYVVKRGDTLYSIARKLGTTVSALTQANRLTNAHFIRVGQVLVVSGTPSVASSTSSPSTSSKVYIVKKGDTLYSIAKRFGVTVHHLKQANNIGTTNLINVGQYLIIPET